MSSKKCQAANPASCVDPKCPEQMYLKNAFKTALATGDFNALFDAKEQERKLKPVEIIPSRNVQDWDRLVVAVEGTNERLHTGVAPVRTKLDARFTGELKDFSSLEELKAYFIEPNPKLVKIITDSNDYDYGENGRNQIPGFVITEFFVSPSLRGQGAGDYIMRTLKRFADQNTLVMELTPTNAGDGKLLNDQPGWRKAAIAHRKRLTDFYESHGFKLNPFYKPGGYRDYLTGAVNEIDWDERAKYSRKAAADLPEHDRFIRYPKGRAPKGWMKRPAKKSVDQF